MRKLSFLFVFLSSAQCYSQGTHGLVAHWNMNGNANDVSGNGHNGTLHNVTATTGMAGAPNTAYLFNGTSSYISVPYSPAFNFTKYSICAIVNVHGFYNGTCQGNAILDRGGDGNIGCWKLRFDDNAYNNCSVLDTTKEVFIGMAGTNGSVSASAWRYSPNIAENTWYRAVVTFDSVYWRIYVNGALMDSALSSAIPMGTSMDSVSIGSNIYGAPNFPYWFNGVIDDIELYDTVLTDSQVVHYGDTCGSITLQPSSVILSVGHTAKFIVHSSIAGASYLWQADMGTGYTDLTNSGPYSGVTTDTLTVTGVTASLSGNHYRCLLTNASTCNDTTTVVLLTVTTGVNTLTLQDAVSVFPNPTNKNLYVRLPYSGITGRIEIIDAVGQLVIKETTNNELTQLDIAELPAGIYIVKVYTQGQTVYKKLIKSN